MHSHRPHKIGRESGFTLVELLLVIAIITILAALLLPALGKAKERGHSARCISNFTDFGVNGQGFFVGATYRNTFSTAPVVPVPLHRASLNVVMADGHGEQISRSEFNQPGGPAVPLPDDPKQNWWREGAVALMQ